MLSDFKAGTQNAAGDRGTQNATASAGTHIAADTIASLQAFRLSGAFDDFANSIQASQR